MKDVSGLYPPGWSRSYPAEMDLGELELAVYQSGFARLSECLEEGALLGLESVLEVKGAFNRRPVARAPLQEWLASTPLNSLMSGLIGEEARVIRAFYLDKTPAENWALAWHQDTTLAFSEPLDVEGFHAWVNKAHFFHAQAPAEVMGRVLSTRIHLDTITAAQGPLKVLPGSHAQGIFRDDAIARLAGSISEAVLPARRGEVFLMRPLLLHGSDRATDPQSRRILHLEWAAFEPPGGLRWAWF